jgi:hypothetical protein
MCVTVIAVFFSAISSFHLGSLGRRLKTASAKEIREWPDKVLKAQKEAEAAQNKHEIKKAKASAPIIVVPPPICVCW